MALKNKVKAGRSPYYEPAVGDVSFSIGAEATNVITVSCQFKDYSGAPLSAPTALDWYLSAAATGLGYAAAASGGVANGTNGFIKQRVTGIEGKAITKADGTLDVAITDNTVRTVYLVFVMPDGTLKISAAITFA